MQRAVHRSAQQNKRHGVEVCEACAGRHQEAPLPRSAAHRLLQEDRERETGGLHELNSFSAIFAMNIT